MNPRAVNGAIHVGRKVIFGLSVRLKRLRIGISIKVEIPVPLRWCFVYSIIKQIMQQLKLAVELLP